MERQQPMDFIVNRDSGDEQPDGMDQMTRMAEEYQRQLREFVPPEVHIPTTGEIFSRQTHYEQRRHMNRPTRSGK